MTLIDRSLASLRRAGYDAYIEYERLYYRTPDGGVIAVYTSNEVTRLIGRAIEKEAK